MKGSGGGLRYLKLLPAGAAVVLLYALAWHLGITCPIKYVTGISCAGCGMTRAWLHLLRLDIRGAVYYHPLFWIPPVFLILYLMRERMGRRVMISLEVVFIALFLGVYVYRMLYGEGNIVVFEPENGLLIRGLRLGRELAGHLPR